MNFASAKDPVCGMTVTIAPDTLRAEYHGETFYFCSASCRQKFLGEPQKFIVPAKDATGQPGMNWTCPMHP